MDLKAGVAVLLATGFLVGASSRPSLVPWGVEEWTQWREDQMESIFAPSRTGGEDLVVRKQVALRCAAALRSVQPRLDDLRHSGPAWAEMKNFVSFLSAQSLMAMPGNALGFTLRDEDYYKANAVHVQLPPLLSSPRFLRLVSSPSGYRDAVAMIEDQNARLPDDKKWVVLPFKARFIMSVDRTTYGRLLVFVPSETVEGRTYDKWITFGIATPDGESKEQPQSVSIVSVMRESKTAYFMDYGRLAGRDGQVRLVATPLMDVSPSKNCYDCHKMAVVPIKPEQEYEFDKAGRLVAVIGFEASEVLNARIRAYGRLTIASLDTAAYGPSLGEPCAQCHSGFAPLNFPEAMRTDREIQSIKSHKGIAQTFVEEGWMPPGNGLSPDERRALWSRLSSEYFEPKTRQGTFFDWLRGKSD